MPTAVVESISALRALLTRGKVAGHRIGLVPTMGALHRGHGALIARARAECGIVAVSVFVNPTQFDRADDLTNYPRMLDADVERCNALGVDVVFAPSVTEMYPTPAACSIAVVRLTEHLCGRHRPGHFQGVATVVMKLLQIAQPDLAYFGEKDAQQLAVVRRLVADFNVPTTIVGVPTVREDDGLALSSRNARLTAEERDSATVLFSSLREAERLIASGVTDPVVVTRAAASLVLRREDARLEYLEIVDPDDLQPVARIAGPVLVAGALWLGRTRLIDNVLCTPPPGGLMEAGPRP